MRRKLTLAIDGSRFIRFSRNCLSFDPSIGRLVVLRSIHQSVQPACLFFFFGYSRQQWSLFSGGGENSLLAEHNSAACWWGGIEEFSILQPVACLRQVIHCVRFFPATLGYRKEICTTVLTGESLLTSSCLLPGTLGYNRLPNSLTIITSVFCSR